MPTVRINIPNAAALDGKSVIPASAVRTDNKALQLVEFTLSVVDTFGFFDPGSVFGNQSADMMLTHFLLSSDTPLSNGSGLYITPPEWQLQGAPLAARRPVFIQGTGLSFDDSEGVMGEGTCLPIPVAHNLSFNTEGSADGPYVIQMSFSPLPKIDQDCATAPTLLDV